MNNLEDIRLWKEQTITKMILRRLEEYFDPHASILGAITGSSVDLLKGQRQVMEKMRHPEELFDGTNEEE